MNLTELYPRKLIYRGSIEAKGLFFDLEVMTIAQARQRVLSLWKPNMTVYNLEKGLLLKFSQPDRIICQFSLGTPLTAVENALLATPLEQDELKKINLSTESLVLVRGGQAVVIYLDDKYLEQVENWLDVEQFTLIKTKSLGEPPTEPRVVVQEANFKAREQLTKLPQSNALAEFLSQLKKVKTRSEETSNPLLGDKVKSGLRKWLGEILGFVGLFKKFFQSESGKSTETSSTYSRSKSFTQTNSEPNWLDKLSNRMKDLATQFLFKTQLASLLGRRQAEYLNKMLELFERGDIQEALRHAIPLGSDIEETLSSISFRKPSPRLDLKIAPASKLATSSISVGEKLLTNLRNIYRSAFERLEAQGRIDEAAFVLAELLKSNEEAVAFLERHGKLQLAAELAEGRNLAAGLIVRQWFLAGEVGRAIMIARKYKAFADAVVRLEKTNKNEAEKLRLLWAGALAEAGDYGAAVNVLWPIQEARSLTIDWINKAIEIGGSRATQMFLKKIELEPESYNEVCQKVMELSEDSSLEAAYARIQFAEALNKSTANVHTRGLARLIVRAIMRDAGSKLPTLLKTTFEQLLTFTGDATLNADAPVFLRSQPELLVNRQEALNTIFSSSDIGTMAIKDLALLPNGRILLALGEVGIRLINRTGSLIKHFDTPAHRLVISDHGDQAIALANRGEVWRLARLDLLKLKATDWCEPQIEAFAPDYDGLLWFVGAKGDFYAIDAQAKRFDALWRVPEVCNKNGFIAAISRTTNYCRFIVNHPSLPMEEWVYSLPKLTLSSRESIGKHPPNFKRDICQVAVCADRQIIVDQSVYCTYQIGDIRELLNQLPSDLEQTLSNTLRIAKKIGVDYQWKEINRGVDTKENFENGTPIISSEWLATPTYYKNETKILIINNLTEKVHQRIYLCGAKQVSLRNVSNQMLAIADDKGRVLVLRLETGEIVKSLRV